MKLIDAHCHLESGPLFADIEGVVQRAADAGVISMITSSITPQQWDISAGLSAKFPLIKYALGIHPWYIEEKEFGSLQMLPSLLEKGASAVGEIGLDRRVASSSFELQEKFFTRQLLIAIETELPVIVHCRGAFDDLKRIIKKNGMPAKGGIIHAFSGSEETAAEMLKLGFSMSLGGSMTWKLSNRRKQGIRHVFPEHFLLETDSPDFVPPGTGLEYNEPANIIYNLKAASAILEVDEEVIAHHSTENAKKIFSIKSEE